MQMDGNYGKFFSDYDDQKRIPYQIKLYKKLENDKSKKSNLLKETNFGIPITIYLLLMRDAMGIIQVECRAIHSKFKEIKKLNTQDILNCYAIQYKDPSFEVTAAGIDWNLNQTTYIEPNGTSISGSTMVNTTQVLVPTSKVIPDNIFKSNTNIIKIHNTVIQIDLPEMEKLL